MPYIKEVFDVYTLDQAKNVVLTSDPRDPDKFERETNFLVETIARTLTISEQNLMLDFGCGMGRMSRALVEKFGCQVVGQDISESMLKFAMLWVRNPKKFSVTQTYPDDNSMDFCLASFVLQHVEDPEKEIKALHRSLKDQGYLIVVNENHRFVPADIDADNYIVWQDDGVNISELLDRYFTLESQQRYLETAVNVVFYKKKDLY